MRVAISAGVASLLPRLNLPREPFDALGQTRNLDRLQQVVDGGGFEASSACAS